MHTVFRDIFIKQFQVKDLTYVINRHHEERQHLNPYWWCLSDRVSVDIFFFGGGKTKRGEKLQGKEIASIRAPARAKGMFNECIKPFDHPRSVGFSSAGRLVAYPVADLKFDQQRGQRKEKHFNGNQ